MDNSAAQRGAARWQLEAHRALALLFAAGGTIAMFVLAVPHGHDITVGPELLTGASGYPVAALLWLRGPRLPRWILDVTLGLGSAVVTVGIYFGHGGGPAVASAFFYTWVALYAGFFLAGRRAAVQVVFAAACYALLLGLQGVRGGGEPALAVLISGILAVSYTVTRALRRQLERSALADPLTGTANRALFTDRLEHALALHARDGRPVAVLWLDLDDFKVVNDSFGHGGGDELLLEVANRLRCTLRDADTLARLGGDEFAVLIEDGSDALRLGERLVEAMQEPFTVAGAPVSLQASVGIAAADGATDLDAETLLAHADTAMYTAKQLGKNRVVAHREGMALPGADELALREPLRVAVRRREVQLHYQAVFNVQTGSVAGFEALARWPGRGVGPDRFIPLAERFGLVLELGDQLIATVVERLAAPEVAGRPLVMSVNLAPAQLADAGLPRRVAQLLERNSVPAWQLAVEITESALLSEDPVARAVTRELHELGVALALDDFGTGYSSLAHLRGFPLDALKVDKAFVADLESNEEARRFTAAVLRLGTDLGLQTVVEGIERPAQLAAVRELGCNYVQGFLLARPAPWEQAVQVLAQTPPVGATRTGDVCATLPQRD